MLKGLFMTLRERAASILAGSLALLLRPFQAEQDGCAQARPVMAWPALGTRFLSKQFLQIMATALFVAATVFPAEAVVLQGKQIINSAWIISDTIPVAQSSVTVTSVQRTPATLTFYAYRPGSSLAEDIMIRPTEYHPGGSPTGTFAPLAPPEFNGVTLSLDSTLQLVDGDNLLLHAGEPLFMTLADGDQNLDPNTAETILVTIVGDTGDIERLRLTETGNNTGIFSGYLMTSTTANSNGDGLLQVVINGKIDGSYTDIADGTDTSADTALVDPLGTVFNSATGEPVDGATVSIYRLNSGDDVGTLATGYLFADDGVTPFPATVTSGDTIYNNPSGGFRFPLIEPGRYRLEITPPGGFRFPSTASISSNLPYVIVVGSRGEPFYVEPGPALRIDIPIDPSDPVDGEMWLSKQVNFNQAAVGDFLQYQLTIENDNGFATMSKVVINDQLPLGFRYQQGSTRINDSKADDPQTSTDGRQLTFALGDIPPASQVLISYVVEVTAGAKVGKATNLAQAINANNDHSNLAEATVQIRKEFFDNSTFLIGRVVDGSCSDPDSDKPGLEGVRIYLEDGSYVITDKKGKYHFEGITPGLHVVQVDTVSLPNGYEMIPCEESSQFAGRNFSQFVDLQGGSLWRVNFYAAPLPAPTGVVTLDLRAKLDGETATFTATATTHKVATKNLRLTVMLPGGFSYLNGSSRRGNISINDPMVTDGSLNFDFPALSADQATTFTFSARLEGAPESGELPTKAVLGFDTAASKGQHTPPAETSFHLLTEIAARSEEVKLYPRFPSMVTELQSTDRAMLETLAKRLQGQKIVRLDIVGHTDSQQITPKSRHIFSDNLALSVARAQSVANFLKDRLSITAKEVSIRGMGESLPVADNSTEAGRALNRRVELYLVTETVDNKATLTLTSPVSPTQSVPVTGLSPAAGVVAATETGNTEESTSSLGLAKGLIAPVSGQAVSRIEAVRIRLDSKLKPRVTLDQNEIPADRIGFSMSDPESKTTLYTYIGVDFGAPGSHKLLVEGIDPFGNARFTQEAELIRTGDIASIRLLETAENLADGRTPVRIRVEIIDVFGRQVHSGITLSMENGELRPLGEKPPGSDGNLDKFNDLVSAELTKQINVDSQGWISFDPVVRSGSYPLRLKANEASLEIDIFVKPEMRDWILVGFAKGTVGYNKLSGNQVSLDEASIDEDFYENDQVKFFAKGAIKGEWLLTLAYDSDKPNRDGDSLHQIIDPDSYYPLYGDGTQQGYEASSASKIFVKLEREQFSALFGDMYTGLSQTELSRYDRNMSGFKSEMQTYNFSYTVFAADTKQAFAKDEIQGDGTSGRYYLTQKNIVTNSETVTIETRDRFHSEQIIDVQTLSRHTDYDIDYDAGSLFFKRPIASKDQHFNPTFIVVRYETLDSNDTNLNYGGRVATRLLDQKVEIGATYVHEEKGSGDGDLYGTDVTVRLTPRTTLHAEAATTEAKDLNDDVSGNAYLAEVTHEADRFRGNVYYREQESGFGLGQQNNSETGTRKYGTEGSYNFSPQLSVAGLLYHEDNLETDAKRDVAQLDGRYAADSYGLHTGLRGARDSFEDGEIQQSSQWLFGGNWVTPNRKLNLHGDYEQSLGSDNENSDYPTLLTLGADYKLTEKISIFTEQEFTWGDDENTDGTRIGFNATPWQGGNMTTTLERQTNENGQRVFALFGFGQSWQANERWSFDASLDRSNTIKDADGPEFNSTVPAAHGASDDFTAVSVGATYRLEKWTWWNRVEARHSESEDKYGASTSVVGEPQDGVAVAAKALAFISEVSGGGTHTDGDIRLGMVYRPTASRWILLNRLDFYFDKEDGDTDYDNWRVVNHLHANFRASRKLQMSFYYGLKYVRDNFYGASYSGFTDVFTFETRYNINKRWDVGLHGSVLHSWNSGTFAYSAGADVGYSPMTNTWVSLGYNVLGFEDEDFSDASYTAEGAYLRFRAKFDQQSVREAAEWINR